ncbi:DUF4184 family protein [Streptomyces sp. NPDC057638]|uniref:DUF4184 family protein n=1 Tax=Streptomyces sp. NPDC057638 TaxID=3346190 RepID=UPI0036B3EBF9
MPFTLSHPAAVLPLLRRPFVPAALVAGAMAPDVPYFLATSGIRSYAGAWYEPYLNATTSHTPTGVLTVTLPFTLALLAGYHLLREPVSALLPAGFRLPDTGTTSATGSAVPRGAARYVRQGAWLTLSALIGIATHLVWDSFTHADGYAVTRVAFLRDPVLGGLTLARLLQHLSTAIGLAALAGYLLRRRARTGRTVPRPCAARPVRWTVIAALVLAALAGAATQTRGIDTYRTVTVYDMSRPIVQEENGVVSETYPSRTERAPWPTVAEHALSDAAKGTGAWLIGALLLYATTWHLRLVPYARPPRGHHARAHR